MRFDVLGLCASLVGVGLAAAGFSWSRAAAAGTERKSVWRILVGPLARRMRPTKNDLDKLVSELLHAGRQGREEIDTYLEEKVLSLFLGLFFGIALGALLGGQLGLLVFLVGLAAGVVLPGKLLSRAAQARRDAVSATLPVAIDLLMTSIDAGLSVEQGMARVARELSRSAPVLSEELGIASNECEAGVPLTESLRRLARRVELDDLSGLCSVIAQAHELGAPIVETLADYAESSRKLRMALLEERAGKLVTKLIFPLALFLLPAALIAILGPAAIQLIRTLN
jgi:tight adherence protein C